MLLLLTLNFIFLAGPSTEQVGTPETITVHSGSLTLRALLWKPAGTGPFPAILYNHGSGPQADPRRPEVLGPVFARHGYVFLYLFRRGAGLSATQGTNSVGLMNRASAEKGTARIRLPRRASEVGTPFDTLTERVILHWNA